MVRPLSSLARFSFVISNIPSLSSVRARCTTVCSRRFSSVGIAAVAVPSRVISRRILHCHYVEKWRAATGHDTVGMCRLALTTRRGPPMSDELAPVLPPNVSPASDERIAHDTPAETAALREFTEVHASYSPNKSTLPASTLLQVPRLSNPAFLLEVEAVAVLPPKA